jgi:hypothetical protein
MTAAEGSIAEVVVKPISPRLDREASRDGGRNQVNALAGLVECEVEDEKGSPVAKLFITRMALRGEEAKGR